MSETLELPGDTFLVRRGDPGGDLFLVEAGSLQAVDTRAGKQVVLAELDVGKVVGELSFLDGSPRSVDLRTKGRTTVRRWRQRDLLDLLDDQPLVSARFYQELARLASHRMRRLSEHALAGRLRSTASHRDGDGDGDEELQRLLQALQSRSWPHVTRGLRALEPYWRGPTRRRLQNRLRTEAAQLLQTAPIARALRARPHGVVASPDLLHALERMPESEGMDGWLSTLPTFLALADHARHRADLLLHEASLLLLGVAPGLSHSHTAAPCFVADPSRAALADLGAHPGIVPHPMDLAALAMGRPNAPLPKADRILVHHLLCYLPDRLALGLLRTCADAIPENGRIVLHTLAPSEDALLLDVLLDWPTLRRSPDALQALVQAAGLVVEERAETDGPAVIWTLTRIAPVPSEPVASHRHHPEEP